MIDRTRKVDENGAIMQAVARRLLAIMSELDLGTVAMLADEVRATRSQASNWVNAYHLPPVPYMITLVRKKNLTLDWIYMGDPSGLTYAAAIRLSAIEQGMHLKMQPAAPPKRKADASQAMSREVQKLAESVKGASSGSGSAAKRRDRSRV